MAKEYEKEATHLAQLALEMYAGRKGNPCHVIVNLGCPVSRLHTHNANMLYIRHR